MNAAQIDVLIVDDSEVVRMLLVHLLEGDPGIGVVTAVNGGAAALDFIAEKLPDVILMDIHMEGMDGFEATRLIMETRPVPVVMCTGVTDPQAATTIFRAYDAGALAVVEKPAGFQHPDHARLSRELLDTVRLMSEVKVVRRWSRSRTTPPPARLPAPLPHSATAIQVVGIGASTGGPPALQTLLAGLPKDFPVPVVVVQHITAGFLPGLAEWLSQTTASHVQIASHEMDARPGHVYLAPDDFHLGFDACGSIRLTKTPPENGLRPAIDHLFRSLATNCGSSAVGVLLTGMGRDGAHQLKALRDCGARTIVQDQATSVVHGMPGAAMALGAAEQVLAIDKIADALCRIVIPCNERGVQP